MLKKLVIASHNLGKVREIDALLADHPLQLIGQGQLNIEAIAETGNSFVENALIKAYHAAEQSGLSALADDSGLIIDALNGEPGVYSARYAGHQATDQQNIDAVLQALRAAGIAESPARFCCVLAWVRYPKDPLPEIFRGIWSGKVVVEQSGTRGFGYDPIFWGDQQSCSAADLSEEIKNQCSHRGQAMQQLKAALSHGILMSELCGLH